MLHCLLTNDDFPSSLGMNTYLKKKNTISNRLTFEDYFEIIAFDCEKYKDKLKMQDIPFTPFQIFWIMSSTSFCDNSKMEVSDPKYDVSRLFALPSYRVNGPKMNSLSFPTDFKCKYDSKMNPIKKCSMFPKLD
ncbi:hypothetical protein D910_02425 [Dendroctonus ponderosae]|uniref:Peptidase M13 C-terminal domain-containing protein n=1 Tax=Dendroctonus ponderosae TaxID=77166 RepID=U4TW42_DENPD|nr:hypothetical protein D910_02425 [Dendroctonus ponderosae]